MRKEDVDRVARAIHEEGWRDHPEPPPLTGLVREFTERKARAAISSMVGDGDQSWECAGRKQSLPEPGECDWPRCGCDPLANRVIGALEEFGAIGADAYILAFLRELSREVDTSLRYGLRIAGAAYQCSPNRDPAADAKAAAEWPQPSDYSKALTLGERVQADEDSDILRLLNALHPGDDESAFMSFSDLSEDQIARARAGVRALKGGAPPA